jgi:hypothetical protein
MACLGAILDRIPSDVNRSSYCLIVTNPYLKVYHFVAYALGMGTVLAIVIVAAAFFQTAVALRAHSSRTFITHFWLAAIGLVR